MTVAARGSWELARGAAGVGFALAAAFNAAVTVRRPEVFLTPAQRDVWLPPWRRLLDDVVAPHPRPVLGAVVVYEAAVASLILARGRSVHVGIVGAMAWAVITTPVLPARQAAGNAALIPALGLLLSRSYDRTTWQLLQDRV